MTLTDEVSQYWPMDAGDELFDLSEWDYHRCLVIVRRLEDTWNMQAEFWRWYLEEFKEGFD